MFLTLHGTSYDLLLNSTNDLNEIFRQEFLDKLVEFIIESLNCLPKEVISSLFILFYFGTSIYYSLVEKLQNVAGMCILDVLNTSAVQGVLNKKNKPTLLFTTLKP